MRSNQRIVLLVTTVVLTVGYIFLFKTSLEPPLVEEPNVLDLTNYRPIRDSVAKLLDNISDQNASYDDVSSQYIGRVNTECNKEATNDSSNESSFDKHEEPSLVFGNGFDFSKCTMTKCFNFTRCKGSGPIKVHIMPSMRPTSSKSNKTLGESNVIHENILRIIRESKHYEADAEKACLFVLSDNTLDRDPLSGSFVEDLSHIFDGNSNYGMNYLVFNLYSGTWPDYKANDFAGLKVGAAILAKASNNNEYHRRYFDISLPLFSNQHPYSDLDELDQASYRKESALEESRPYFLTFKGKRYVFGSGSETRNSLYHINNQRDVIMLTTCRHGKKWRELSDDRCAEDESVYDRYDFVELMKRSLFCLTPRGRRLGSFRYLEALSYGCVPVIMSDGWVKPFDEIIDWSCAALDVAESELLQVADILRDLEGPKGPARALRANCLALYESYFSTMQRIILTSISIVERRVRAYNDARGATGPKRRRRGAR